MAKKDLLNNPEVKEALKNNLSGQVSGLLQGELARIPELENNLRASRDQIKELEGEVVRLKKLKISADELVKDEAQLARDRKDLEDLRSKYVLDRAKAEVRDEMNVEIVKLHEKRADDAKEMLGTVFQNRVVREKGYAKLDGGEFERTEYNANNGGKDGTPSKML